MIKRKSFTVSEKIVLAAYQIEREDRAPFSAESLIVAVWESDPETFGLRSYSRKHPDSSIVFSALLGQSDLLHQGWFLHHGPRLYILSRQGRCAARSLTNERHTGGITLKTDSEEYARLEALISGPTRSKWISGERKAITFVDACRFWQLTERDRGSEVNARLTAFPFFLSELDRGLDGQVLLSEQGERMGDELLEQLEKLHEYLLVRFERHLTLLRRRTLAG